MGSKKIIKNQKYEDYWYLTLEYTDFNGPQFNNVLRMIVDYIDKYVNISDGMSSKQYGELQSMIEAIYPKKDSASTRKSINQFFKLGFINNEAKGYHHLTKRFLDEKDVEQKRLIYSKIMYDNASFNRSFSRIAEVNEIRFLVKTIDVCGRITKDELMALMFTKIESCSKGYLTPEELKLKFAETVIDKTDKRKYNQRNYLFTICGSLTDVYVKNNEISLNPDLLIDRREKTKTRDPYLQRLYKIELITEVKELYNITMGECVLEHLPYPVLIASHIKPYIECDDKEAFDVNNGLLLSKNLDSLFDLGFISFDNEGTILLSDRLEPKVKDAIKHYQLDEIIYNDIRKNYMEYHRENVFH